MIPSERQQVAVEPEETQAAVAEPLPLAAASPPHSHQGTSPAPTNSTEAPRAWLFLLFLLLLVVAGTVAFFTVPGLPGAELWQSQADGKKPAQKAPLAVELVEGQPDTIFVPEQVREALGVKGTTRAESPTKGKPLVIPGSTALDPGRIMRVRTRFNAEVREIGKVNEPGGPETSGQTVTRELRPGDRVRKDQTLAVVWSIDVGGKKSDVVDALVQLRLDEIRLEARTKLWQDGFLPEDTLNQTKRDVISDRNALERAVRTLRTWNVPEKEIDAAREEAEKTLSRKGKRDVDKERLWVRSEIIAPRDGTLIERNVSIGEYVADNTISLFIIADVSRILILANPPEDALPALLKLKPDQLRWSLDMVGGSNLVGRIDEIGYILDPNQHTAVVKGYIPNIREEDGSWRLRAGQFVSARVELPPPPGVVEVPIGALAEDGNRSFLFVEANAAKHQYTLRRVLVTHRFEKTAFVKSRLTPQEMELSPEDKTRGVQPCKPLPIGTRFLTTGVLELRAALEDLLLKNKPER